MSATSSRSTSPAPSEGVRSAFSDSRPSTPCQHLLLDDDHLALSTATDSPLFSLPPELHREIFSHLDQIDSTCLGLTDAYFYSIHRHLHGKVGLGTRRKGPNNLESVWKGYATRQCAMCGDYRCELHMHIRNWMPANYEYCHVKEMYGPRAIDDASPSCYRNVPPEPTRCGRHPLAHAKCDSIPRKTLRLMDADKMKLSV